MVTAVHSILQLQNVVGHPEQHMLKATWCQGVAFSSQCWQSREMVLHLVSTGRAVTDTRRPRCPGPGIQVGVGWARVGPGGGRGTPSQAGREAGFTRRMTGGVGSLRGLRATPQALTDSARGPVLRAGLPAHRLRCPRPAVSAQSSVRGAGQMRV